MDSDSSNVQNMMILEMVSLACESDDDCNIEDLLNSSSSSSDENEEDAMAAATNANRRGTLNPRPRLSNYVERIVPEYSSQEFKSHFRMLPETFLFVLGLIGPRLSSTSYVAGRKPISPKKQLLLAIWMMATPDSYRSVCEKFNVGRATALRAVRRVTSALYCLAPRFIQWPKGDRAREVMEEFEQNSAFPNVIGAIDGTHIKIEAPKSDGRSYVNRKGYHSVQVQAVCTQKLLFTSVFAGNTGCVHDARVFRLSPVYNHIQQRPEYFPNDSHIIGDAAYGIHPKIMVPFKDNGHLTRRQKNFNFCLSSARVSIERAFGLWKCRWRSIRDCLPMTTVEKIPEYLLATCVLHNICILQGDLVQFEETLRVSRRGSLIPQQRFEGNAKRQRIMNDLIIRDI